MVLCFYFGLCVSPSRFASDGLPLASFLSVFSKIPFLKFYRSIVAVQY